MSFKLMDSDLAWVNGKSDR